MFRNNFLFESNKINNDAHDTSHTLYEKFHTKCLVVSYFMFTFVIEIKTMVMKTYRICYSYNNGTNMSETVNAQSGIDALKKAKAVSYLKQSMFQTGSKGKAEAYELSDDGTRITADPEIAIYCEYRNGKWHTHRD